MPHPSTGVKRAYSARRSYDEEEQVAASTASGQPRAQGDPSPSEALNNHYLDDFDAVTTIQSYHNLGLYDNNLDHLPPPVPPTSPIPPPSPLTPLEELGPEGREFRGWRNETNNYHLFDGENLSGPEEVYEWPRPPGERHTPLPTANVFLTGILCYRREFHPSLLGPGA
jgi:hypothetical protein